MINVSSIEKAFWELNADDGTGLRTSTGLFYNHTVFARDVAMIARWILPLGKNYQQVSREVILTLCWHQGVETNPRAEEQPGRIHNEYRKFSAWQAPMGVKTIGRLVSLLWGGNLHEYTSYIAVDTTPLFVQLVCAYATQVDRGILDEVAVRHDGREVRVGQCLKEAIDWIVHHRQGYGLIANARSNPLSLYYEVWKDSHTALIHNNGRLASLSRPVAYLDTQLLAVDALRAAAGLLAAENLESSQSWLKIADELVEVTLERFWEPGEQRFYAALDHDRQGKWRPVMAEGSNSGWLLDSTFFDNLEGKPYMEAIVRQLLGPDFLTPAGIRARAVGSDKWIKAADYHGSHTVWPVDNYVFARGLRRQGLPQLAEVVEQRLLRAVEKAGAFYEYFLVASDGRVVYEPHRVVKERYQSRYRRLPRMPVQILPERQLAWTISACLLIQKGSTQAAPSNTWAQALQEKLVPHLLEVETENDEVPFVPALYRGAGRITQIAIEQWVREYIFRR